MRGLNAEGPYLRGYSTEGPAEGLDMREPNVEGHNIIKRGSNTEGPHMYSIYIGP